MASTDEMNANFFFPTCTTYHLFIHSITLLITLYLPIFSANSFVPCICFSFCTIYLTNRFHVAVRLFSNRSQMTSKCGKNKKVAHEAIAECVTDVLTTF